MSKKTESLEEMAKRFETMIDDDSQDSNWVQVTAEVDQEGSIYATKFSLEEAVFIVRAAEAGNLTVFEFIRAAALAAAAGELDLSAADKVEALHDAQAKARDLAKALQRL